MSNNITLKFEVQTGDARAAYSLMDLVVDKIKVLQEKCRDIRYIEVNLFKPDARDENKTALFRVISNEADVTETSSSSHWQDALLNAFDKACLKFKQAVGVA